mmetsp:Transcript_145581/g.465214  ORF Transcript_145581/g.465214 Transcript_145581/m.465214 type:complete len:237 (-) Transcript_145581:328-1038(-)
MLPNLAEATSQQHQRWRRPTSRRCQTPFEDKVDEAAAGMAGDSDVEGLGEVVEIGLDETHRRGEPGLLRATPALFDILLLQLHERDSLTTSALLQHPRQGQGEVASAAREIDDLFARQTCGRSCIQLCGDQSGKVLDLLSFFPKLRELALQKGPISPVEVPSERQAVELGNAGFRQILHPIGQPAGISWNLRRRHCEEAVLVQQALALHNLLALPYRCLFLPQAFLLLVYVRLGLT